MSALTTDQALAVEGILCRYFGGYFDGDTFRRYVAAPLKLGHHEWRFCGSLGFGGKFHFDGRRAYVSCYPEDHTPERMDAIASANRELAQIVEASDGKR